LKPNKPNRQLSIIIEHFAGLSCTYNVKLSVFKVKYLAYIMILYKYSSSVKNQRTV